MSKMGWKERGERQMRARQFQQHRGACGWKAPSVWKVQCWGHFTQTQAVASINHLHVEEKAARKPWRPRSLQGWAAASAPSASRGGSPVGLFLQAPSEAGNHQLSAFLWIRDPSEKAFLCQHLCQMLFFPVAPGEQGEECGIGTCGKSGGLGVGYLWIPLCCQQSDSRLVWTTTPQNNKKII